MATPLLPSQQGGVEIPAALVAKLHQQTLDRIAAITDPEKRERARLISETLHPLWGKNRIIQPPGQWRPEFGSDPAARTTPPPSAPTAAKTCPQCGWVMVERNRCEEKRVVWKCQARDCRHEIPSDRPSPC